jgi:hypothetical protein
MWPDAGDAACRVEHASRGISRVKQEQRMIRQLADVDGVSLFNLEGRGAGRHDMKLRQQIIRETVIVDLDDVDDVDRQMHFAALEHGQMIGRVGLDQSQTDPRNLFGVAAQKARKDGFYRQRGASHFEDFKVAAA